MCASAASVRTVYSSTSTTRATSCDRLRDIAALEDRNRRRHADLVRRWVADAANLLDRINSLGPKVTTNV